MDLKIKIYDEDNELIRQFSVYQDGSDAEGAALIEALVDARLDIEDDDDTTERRLSHGDWATY